MELASLKLYIHNLIAENFNAYTFSPEKSGELFNLFKKIFYIDSPYWSAENENTNTFCVEFKKYGKNRRRVFLRSEFVSNSAEPRMLNLTLTNEHSKTIDGMSAELSLSEVWKDHAILANHLYEYAEKGLYFAAETY